MTKQAPGTLLAFRDRDWVVLSSDADDLLRLRPIDGPEHEAIGLVPALEPEEPRLTQYDPPNPERASDIAGARLVFDSARLALRSGAGPFRSLGRLSVTPRPYQYVPLLMALKLDPVRLLIADDVGVGKTIEAGMIARELLDRGIVSRVGVLCAPHLCEQWANELADKFQIEAAIVQPSRMARLERRLPPNVNVFQNNQHVVCSIDFVKSDTYRQMFIDSAPELIIVDEAHTAARPAGDETGNQHRRHQLLRDLCAARPNLHVILATATPHSGVEESFRSLLGLLEEGFDSADDLNPRRLARHLIQRQRSDLEDWLGTETPFPERRPDEYTYLLDPSYRKLFDDVLAYCRETVAASDDRSQRQRVRYWAAIAILRCLLSSPASAASMLDRRRDRMSERDVNSEGVDPERHRAQILDSSEDDQTPDFIPTSALDDPEASLTEAERRRLSGFLSRAETLKTVEEDAKLRRCCEIAAELLRDGHSPIIYCRYIDTAVYVAQELEQHLRTEFPALQARSVTGSDGDSEQRREIVTELARSERRILVATDCLSEGVNLQQDWDAVIHYDLPWNPNRLEQREGRVDRYGQHKPVVRVATLVGLNNEIDLVVMRVLIEKARKIYRSLGIAVPVPVGSEDVLNAVIDSVLLRGRANPEQLQLNLEGPQVSEFHELWDRAANDESRRRTRFAQHGISPEIVETELGAIQPIFGNDDDLRRFATESADRLVRPDLAELADKGRNHPDVERAAHDILAMAFGDEPDPFVSRCGAISTDAVSLRTAVLLLRLRYTIRERGTDLFAEEIVPAAFRRDVGELVWLDSEEALGLMDQAEPTGNLRREARVDHVRQMLDVLQQRESWQADLVEQRRTELHEAHLRLREQIGGRAIRVTAHDPDILGCYVFVPDGSAVR
ncbi:MAG: DEAD/DEAH box helicase [Chloroflexi bacterium]|nr:DEAD/DEAH box helicase [Chloroflexota bacterium]